MSALHINLPDDLKRAAEKQVSSGRYSNLSDYLSSLIRQDQDQDRAEQEGLERLLRDRMSSGEAKPMSDGDFDAIRNELYR